LPEGGGERGAERGQQDKGEQGAGAVMFHLTFPIWFNAHERRGWFS
jgi:hypothetical protein